MEIRRVRYDAFHEVFEGLDRSAVLWRYMDLTKLLAILESQTLHFARTDQLHDPFEGSVTLPMSASVTTFLGSSMTPDAIAHADASLRLARERARLQTYVSCWNHSEIESDALWGRYVQPEIGIAIRTTFGRLVDSFGNDPLPPVEARAGGSTPARESVLIGKVNYVDYASAVWPVSNGFWPFVHKRLSFSYESEVRAVIWDVPPVLDDPTGTPLGLNVAIDVGTLIESVWVSPVAPTWLLDLVQAACRRYGARWEVRRSALAEAPLY